jgi:3-hydroxyisobutyryl-CoA hydrolase
MILKVFESTKKLVIIKGAGPKAFCAGGDVRSVVEGPLDKGINFFRKEYRMNELIGSYRKPYIAIIDGITMGGGVGLSVHGKYRVATERTLFAMPETAIGLFPDVGGGHFLSRLPGKLGLYLGLTGFRLKGRDVQKAGIATHYVESSKLEELEDELTGCESDLAVSKILYKYSSLFKDSSDFVLAENLEKINQCFAGATVEQIFKNLEEDGSGWAIKTLEGMKKMSPTSMKLTHKQLELGKDMTLRECLQMEFRMAAHCTINSDFKEGVRALLVDKDQNPKWECESIEKVSEERVASFFVPLPEHGELVFDNPNPGRL